MSSEYRDLVHALDAAEFARERLGFHPDERQGWLLERPRKRVLLNCTRQWGKSTVTAAKAVHRAYFYEDSLTLVVSPSGRQSAEFLQKAARLARRLGLAARGDGDNEISLGFPNGSRIVGLPGVEDTVRGFSAVALLVVDEAARVKDEVYKAVRPMLAVGSGELWLMSTPCGKRGFFWEEWSNADREWERVMVPATACPRIPKEFLEEERAAHGDRWFRQEYLCEFTDADDAVFREADIGRAVTEEVKPLF